MRGWLERLHPDAYHCASKKELEKARQNQNLPSFLIFPSLYFHKERFQDRLERLRGG
jgi:hypothetical protein